VKTFLSFSIKDDYFITLIILWNIVILLFYILEIFEFEYTMRVIVFAKVYTRLNVWYFMCGKKHDMKVLDSPKLHLAIRQSVSFDTVNIWYIFNGPVNA